MHISIHALLAESDRRIVDVVRQDGAFLSTLSLRRATLLMILVMISFRISIHALLAESDDYDPDKVIDYLISIHALLAESDQSRGLPAGIGPNFYPRSPCGERLLLSVRSRAFSLFLSTLSLRRATSVPGFSQRPVRISIHALLAESDAHSHDAAQEYVISIHALLAESDAVRGTGRSLPAYFYPRSPCGERRAPEGSDFGHKMNFYPRSPCGERRALACPAGFVL